MCVQIEDSPQLKSPICFVFSTVHIFNPLFEHCLLSGQKGVSTVNVK